MRALRRTVPAYAAQAALVVPLVAKFLGDIAAPLRELEVATQTIEDRRNYEAVRIMRNRFNEIRRLSAVIRGAIGDAQQVNKATMDMQTEFQRLSFNASVAARGLGTQGHRFSNTLSIRAYPVTEALYAIRNAIHSEQDVPGMGDQVAKAHQIAQRLFVLVEVNDRRRENERRAAGETGTFDNRLVGEFQSIVKTLEGWLGKLRDKQFDARYEPSGMDRKKYLQRALSLTRRASASAQRAASDPRFPYMKTAVARLRVIENLLRQAAV